ncbi:hypothetical protein HALLA_12200 [Halostagnicola larsenii XH-48]|uniref:Uncharacterized protein n=1 Tax=Halostagnicola larsenii XH-48 TaxID=797299 RepID=W0JQV4_9EURY|nr:hypothetical protein [Halostagnicola larsenii]AHG00933.1 hypothetical protein HALLA_11890 [Halostagnicola larsenii XH-48]AHG00984.1 hypothetical protein HALLA_12200 [Halostagnicola larsenii XH-48]
MSITAADVRGQDADPRREDQYRAEALEIERAKATTAPEVRCDGGESDHAELRECETRDDDNAHAKGNLEQKKIAEAELDREPIDIGDHVQDRDDPDSTMVVVGLPLEPANEVTARGDKTVADFNTDYPADDDVVEVVFPDRTDVEIEPLTQYGYPRSRIEIVAHVHDRDGDDGGAE